MATALAWRWDAESSGTTSARPRAVHCHRIAAAAGLLACILLLARVHFAATAYDPAKPEEDQRAAATAARAAIAERVRYRGGESLFAAYGGAPYTYPSDIHIARPGTDLTAHRIDWLGKPFSNPIYYGLRYARWLPASAIGGMVDFTHSKVYSQPDQVVRLSGSRDGKALPPSSRIGDMFHKLEFTHGHNMLTFNGLWRLPLPGAFISPYLGAGAGVALPHTEVQLKGEGLKTYEYQYTGPVVQWVAGIEIRVPYLSYFIEYKFSFASYRAPLHDRDGSRKGLCLYESPLCMVQDLWHQLGRWWRGGVPEGGWATTRLTSHQMIGGLGYRTAPTAASP